MTTILIVSHPAGRNAISVIVAMAASTLWAGAFVAFLIVPAPAAVLIALDALVAFAWTACTLSWLGKSWGLVKRALLALSGLLGTWSVVVSALDTADGTSGPGQSVWLALLGMALLGLMSVEQLFRNADDEQRERIRPLCFGIGGLFAVNVFVYSQASLLGGVVPGFWEARGLPSAVLVPIVVLTLKRMSEWETELFVSRHVVFYTASLLAVGAYLLAMGTIGYAIVAFGGEWGVLLQTLFLVAALAILVFVLFSAKIRARAKVLLVKHFYKHRYDYREEWLRLTAKLARGEDSGTLAHNALEGIARIVNSRSGALWITVDGERYECIAALNADERSAETYGKEHRLVRFLATSGWVVDTDQYRRDPARYDRAFGDPGDSASLPFDGLVLPLDRQGYLQGFAVLSPQMAGGELNFEDHDILKTAGRQVAAVLAQALAQEQLAATRQFEAMNKLSTFLMHDLKNVVAQHELLLANAKKFKHRPDFIEDAVRTMEGAARRMRAILDRLENAPQTAHVAHVDLVKLLHDVCDQCADREPQPRLLTSIESYRANVDRDRLAMAITHAIRNAQDATAPDGRIDVRFSLDKASVAIEVSDTGTGMTREFVRDRLFKPFDSTKGAKGMGIGAYQIKETFAAAGGEIHVDSGVGRGTTLRMTLPVTSDSPTERSVA